MFCVCPWCGAVYGLFAVQRAAFCCLAEEQGGGAPDKAPRATDNAAISVDTANTLAGGAMTLPTAATVTLKTRLTGTINVYLYDEDTGKFTLVASPAAKDGTVTFTTRRMGFFLLTTGRI